MRKLFARPLTILATVAVSHVRRAFQMTLLCVVRGSHLQYTGLTWTRERVQRICFTDEVWAYGGAHTNSYVTVLKDGSDRLLPECVRHKYSKLPAWMFHGCIVDGKKGPCLFWEKRWGTINSTRYDEKILSMIEQFICRDHALDGYIFWQSRGEHLERIVAA